MSAPQQLTDQQRAHLLRGHYSLRRRDMVRYWQLSEQDIRRVNARRRRHNRLGFAVQLCLLRYPGWPLKPNETPPQNLLDYAALQLGVDPEEIAEYPSRDRTRREHVQWLARTYGFWEYRAPFPAPLWLHLRSEALSTDSAFTLVQAALGWLRQQRVILPALGTLEALVRSVRNDVEREIYQRLTIGLSKQHQTELDKLLDLGPPRGSLLGWLRRVPRSCSAAGILDLIQRLNWVRGLDLPKDLGNVIPEARLRQLAARGARHSVAHFRRFPDHKRRAILAAFLIYVTQEITDRVTDFHNRLIGRLFHESEKSQWIEFVDHGPVINEKLHNYSRLTRAIAQAHKEGRSLDQAIETVFSWEALERESQETARLAKPLESSQLAHFRSHFHSFDNTRPNSWRHSGLRRSRL